MPVLGKLYPILVVYPCRVSLIGIRSLHLMIKRIKRRRKRAEEGNKFLSETVVV